MKTPPPLPTVIRRGLGLPALLAVLSLPLYSATYYIDHAGGNNAADGLAPASAWRHAPGDSAATGNPAAIVLQPGDTVLFKGGVPYFGSLTIARSGSTGNPITYDGNTAGAYGEGPAILDGGQVLSGWQPVGSAAAVKNNPLWRDMFYVDIDVDVTSNTSHDQVVGHRFVSSELMAPWHRIVLSDGDRRILSIAQQPKPADPFYTEIPDDFHVSPHPLQVVGGMTRLTDPARLTATDPAAYAGVMVGIHAGNNIVCFADIKGFDPAQNRITFPATSETFYPQTRYALYNSPAFIERPGEWTITPLGNGQSRIHLLPLRLENGLPANVAYPVLATGVTVTGGASHLRIQGFLIQRYAGGEGGVSIARNNNPRSRDIAVTGNEIRFVGGNAGIDVNYANDLVVRDNTVRHCPGWTTGIFLNRATGFDVSKNHLLKNSGSGIRLYQGIDGLIAGNSILDHYGIHSSAVNLYEGCADILVEDNFIENTVAINRNAERLTLRNNVIDAQNRNPAPLTLWFTGTTAGTAIRDIHILNNTLVNNDQTAGWATGLFAQGGATPPEGLVVRGNILDRPSGTMLGVFEDNIYLRQPATAFMGPGCQVVSDPATLFRDPANRDFRRLPGGPLSASGANLLPPVGDTGTAGVISISLDEVQGRNPMSPAHLAGAAPHRVSNWNNARLDAQGNVIVLGEDLVYQDGSTVGDDFAAAFDLRATWTPASPHSVDPRLFAAYGELGNIGTTPVLSGTISLLDIPFDYYSIRVYASGGAATRGGSVSLGSETFYLRGNSAPAADGSGYLPAVSTSWTPGAQTGPGGVAIANYADFERLAGSDQIVSLTALDMGNAGTIRLRLAGIQIIETPAPRPMDISSWEGSGLSADTGLPGIDGLPSIAVAPGALAVLPLRSGNDSGKIVFYVHDDGTLGSPGQIRGAGPRWGIVQADGRVLVAGVMYAPYLEAAGSLALMDVDPAAPGAFFNLKYVSGRAGRHWRKWEFDFNPDTGLKISIDGIPLAQNRFDWNQSQVGGFTGLVLYGDTTANPQTLRVSGIEYELGGPMNVQPSSW